MANSARAYVKLQDIIKKEKEEAERLKQEEFAKMVNKIPAVTSGTPSIALPKSNKPLFVQKPQPLQTQPFMTGSSAVNIAQKTAQNPLFRSRIGNTIINTGITNPAPYAGKANALDTLKSIGSQTAKTIGEIGPALKEGLQDVSKTDYIRIPAAIGAGGVGIAKSGASFVKWGLQAQEKLTFARQITDLLKLPAANDSILNTLSQGIDSLDKVKTNLQNISYGNNENKAEAFIAKGIELATEMLPNILFAMYSGGASTAANAGNLVKFANTSKSLLPGITQGSIEMFKNQFSKMLVFGAQAFGNAVYQAEKDGANFAQQTIYGLSSAFNEMITEMIPMGALEKAIGIGDDLVKKYAKKGLENTFKYYGGKVLSWSSSALQNVLQEIAVNPMTALAEKAAYNPEKKWVGSGGIFDKEQVLPSAEGALGMSLVFAAMGLPYNSMARQHAQSILELEELSDFLNKKSEQETLIKEIAYEIPKGDKKTFAAEKEVTGVTTPESEATNKKASKYPEILPEVGDKLTVRFNKKNNKIAIKITGVDAQKGRYTYETVDEKLPGVLTQEALNIVVNNVNAETKVERQERIKQEKKDAAKQAKVDAKAKAEEEKRIKQEKQKTETEQKKQQKPQKTVTKEPKTAQQHPPVSESNITLTVEQPVNPLFSNKNKQRQQQQKTVVAEPQGKTAPVQTKAETAPTKVETPQSVKQENKSYFTVVTNTERTRYKTKEEAIAAANKIKSLGYKATIEGLEEKPVDVLKTAAEISKKETVKKPVEQKQPKDLYAEADIMAEEKTTEEIVATEEGTVKEKAIDLTVKGPKYEVGGYGYITTKEGLIPVRVTKITNDNVVFVDDSNGKKYGLSKKAFEARFKNATEEYAEEQIAEEIEKKYSSSSATELTYKKYVPKYLYKAGDTIDFLDNDNKTVVTGKVIKTPLENGNIITLEVPNAKKGTTTVSFTIDSFEQRMQKALPYTNAQGKKVAINLKENTDKIGLKEEIPVKEASKEPVIKPKKSLSKRIYKKGDVITFAVPGTDKIAYGIVDSVSADGAVRYFNVKAGKELKITKMQGSDSYTYKVVESEKTYPQNIFADTLDTAIERAQLIRSSLSLPIINTSKYRSTKYQQKVEKIIEENNRKIAEWEKQAKYEKELALKGVRLRPVPVTQEQTQAENISTAANSFDNRELAAALINIIESRTPVKGKADYLEILNSVLDESQADLTPLLETPEFMIPFIKMYAKNNKTSLGHIMNKLNKDAGGAYSQMFKSATFLRKLYEGETLTKRMQADIERAETQLKGDLERAISFGVPYLTYINNKNNLPIFEYDKGTKVNIQEDLDSKLVEVTVIDDVDIKTKKRTVNVLMPDGTTKTMMYFQFDNYIDNANRTMRRKDMPNDYLQLPVTDYFKNMLKEEENANNIDLAIIPPVLEKQKGEPDNYIQGATYTATHNLSADSKTFSKDIQEAIKLHYTTYGNINEYENIKSEAEKLLRTIVELESDMTPKNLPNYRIVGRAFSEELLSTGKINILHQRISDVSELGILAQIFRNPKMETTRVVYVKGDEIVATTAVTARMPQTTPLSAWGGTGFNFVFKENTREIFKATGADGFYILHNHPFVSVAESGHLSPSYSDMLVTMEISDYYKDKFKGHVVINSGEFVTISPNDLTNAKKAYDNVDNNKIIKISPEFYSLHKLEGITSDNLYKWDKPHQLLFKKLGRNPQDYMNNIATYAKSMEKGKTIVTLAFTNQNNESTNTVVGVIEVDASFLDNDEKTVKAYLRDMGQMFGADNVSAIFDGKTVFGKYNLDSVYNLYIKGYISDVAMIGEETSLSQQGNASSNADIYENLQDKNPTELIDFQIVSEAKNAVFNSFRVKDLSNIKYDVSKVALRKYNNVATTVSKYRLDEIERNDLYKEALKDESTQDIIHEQELERQYDALIYKNKEKIKAIKTALKENKLTGEMTPEEVKAAKDTVKQLFSINIMTQKAINKMSAERAQKVKAYVKKYTINALDIISDSDAWKEKSTNRGAKFDKMKNQLALLRETIARTIYDMAGTEVGRRFEENFVSPMQMNSAAAEENFIRQIRATEKFFKLNSKEAYATVAYIEGTKTDAELAKEGIDIDKIKGIADSISNELEQIYSVARVVLARNGIKTPGHLIKYFPHKNSVNELGKQLYDDVFKASLNELKDMFEVKIDTTPTDLTGIIAELHPNKVASRFLKRRMTDDVFAGNPKQVLFDYFASLNRVIYHTEDILALRALERELGDKYAPAGVAKRIAIMNNDESMSDEMKEYTKNKLLGTTGKFLEFINILSDYTGVLAGKENPADTVSRKFFGNYTYQMLNKLLNNTAINAIALNFKMLPTNLAQIPQVFAILPNKFVAEAMTDTIKALAQKDDGLKQASSFYMTRASAYRKSLDSIQNAINSMSSLSFAADLFVSEVAVRAAYLTYLNKGLTPQEAMRKADLFASKAMGDRAYGMLPPLFYMKNPVARAFTMFQVEANNQYSFVFKDMPELAKEFAELKFPDDMVKQQKAYHMMLLGMVTKLLIGILLFNEPYEKITGRRLLPDVFDMSKDFVMDIRRYPKRAFINLVRDAAQYTPLIGSFFGGGKLPMDSSLVDVAGLFDRLTTAFASNDYSDFVSYLLADTLWKVPSALFPYGGVGQFRKTAQGLDSILRGGVYTTSGKMMYPSENTIPEKAKAILFGKYSSDTARNYYRKGSVPLSESQTKAVLNSNDPNKKYASIIFQRFKDKLAQERKAIFKKDLSLKEEKKRLQSLENRLELVTRDYEREFGY